MSNVPPFNPADVNTLDLTPRMERGARPIRYLLRYEAEPMVECAFCLGHTLHRHGFIVEMDDGRTGHCGRCCARNFFGDEVASALDADLRRREKRREVEAFLAPVLVGVGSAIAAIEPWLELEREIDVAVAGLAYIGASAAVNLDGLIDWFDEEVVEGQEVRRDGRMRTVRSIRRKRVVRVRGASIFRGRSRCLEQAIACLEIIRAKGASDTTKLTNHMLAYLKGKRGDAFGLMREGIERIHAAKILFTRDSIEELGRWCRTQKAKPELRWTESITGPVISLRAPRFEGTVQIPVPRIDAVPALEDVLGHLRQRAA